MSTLTERLQDDYAMYGIRLVDIARVELMRQAKEIEELKDFLAVLTPLVDATRIAFDNGTEGGDKNDFCIMIRSHEAAAVSLCLDEIKVVVRQQGTK
jgi:hypothetical protein